MKFPDTYGYYGKYGGIFVADNELAELDKLAVFYNAVKSERTFVTAYNYYLREFACRETPLYYAAKFSANFCGAKIYLKREDRTATGSYHINNVIGQMLLAKAMHKEVVITEAGSGGQAIAAAAFAAYLKLKCIIYAGAEDIRRQPDAFRQANIFMPEIIPVEEQSGSLTEAVISARRAWLTQSDKAYYLASLAAAPYPYSLIVRDLNTVIGSEICRQTYEKERKLPDCIFAASSAGGIVPGIFNVFLNKNTTELYLIEAAAQKEGTAPLMDGRPGVMHGFYSSLSQNKTGQIKPRETYAAELNYPAAAPELCWLKEQQKLIIQKSTAAEALSAYRLLLSSEGLSVSFDSAFALAAAILKAQEEKDKIIVVPINGEGYKDHSFLEELAERLC